MSNISGFFKGMATGVAIGAAATMVLDPLSDRERKKLAKKTEGVFRNIGSVIDTAVDMMHK